jgi:hypothetical protein
LRVPLNRIRDALPGDLSRLWYLPLVTAATAVMFIRLLAYAAVLPAPEFASLSAGLLLSGLQGLLACAGLQLLAQRDLPILMLQHRHRRGAMLLWQAAIVAAAFALAFAAATGAGVRWPALDTTTALVAIVHGLVQQLFLLVTIESRSRGDFLRFGWQSLGRALVLALVGYAAANLWGDAISTLCAEAIAGALLLIQMQVSARRSRSASGMLASLQLALRRLLHVRWSSAFVLLAANAAAYVSLNLDRWVGSGGLDARQFGVYAFACLGLLAANQAQAIIASAAFPWLVRRAASRGISSAKMTSGVLSALVLLVSVVLGPGAVWLMSWAIQRRWPHMAGAIELLPAMLACAAFRVADFWSSFLIAAGQERRLFWFTLISVVLAGAGWLFWAITAAQPMTPATLIVLPLSQAIVMYVFVLAAALATR